MVKKRPTLDAFLNLQSQPTDKKDKEESPNVSRKRAKVSEVSLTNEVAGKANFSEITSPSPKSPKPEIIRHMLYLPLPVYDQLQGLIFEEQRGQTKRRKTHDYLLDAIDLLFKEKGLKSIEELTKKIG